MKNVLFAVLMGIIASEFAFAQVSTPQYYRCENRVGGSWTYGRAPYACDSRVWGDDTFVFQNYNDFIFSDQLSRGQETIDYMSRMHVAIDQVLTWYLLERNPNASRGEQEIWRQAIFAKLNQESFWSHYRLASDNRLKHMRGDYGHGHGIGQIDDRWHFAKIEDGIAWDLFRNLIYGLEIFYREWVRALDASCVTGPASISRVRAAYSAYNGGPSQLCRWTNPNARWARNDTNYLNKLNAKSWEKHIQAGYELTVDPICLAKRDLPCGRNPDDDGYSFENGDLLKLRDNKICVYVNEELRCLEDSADAACMSAIYSNVDDSIVEVSDDAIEDYQVVMFERQATCKRALPALVEVGNFIKLKKSINLRSTPGGGRLTTAEINSVNQVLDFFINGQETKSLYYKINYQNNVGWIYAGNLNTADEWATYERDAFDDNALLAGPSDTIQIKNSYGINLRATPGGTYISRVPVGTLLIVIDRKIIGSNQTVYYQVRYRGNTGWIYAGAMKPTNYLPNWTEKI